MIVLAFLAGFLIGFWTVLSFVAGWWGNRS